MWYELPFETAAIIPWALRTLAEHSQLAVDHLCTRVSFTGPVEILERARHQCVQLADQIEHAHQTAEADQRPSLVYHLPQPSASLALQALRAIEDAGGHQVVELPSLIHALTTALTETTVLLPNATVTPPARLAALS